MTNVAFWLISDKCHILLCLCFVSLITCDREREIVRTEGHRLMFSETGRCNFHLEETETGLRSGSLRRPQGRKKGGSQGVLDRTGSSSFSQGSGTRLIPGSLWESSRRG